MKRHRVLGVGDQALRPDVHRRSNRPLGEDHTTKCISTEPLKIHRLIFGTLDNGPIHLDPPAYDLATLEKMINIDQCANPFDLALPVTAMVNALASLPFALRILRPQAEEIRITQSRLAATLGLSSFAWLRWVVLPRLRRPLGFAAGLTAALSMGDLGVIALFADPDRTTLPMQIYYLMRSYQMESAASAALLLLILSLGAFWLFDRGGRAHVAA